jgi:hypothetical protein
MFTVLGATPVALPKKLTSAMSASSLSQSTRIEKSRAGGAGQALVGLKVATACNWMPAPTSTVGMAGVIARVTG